MFSYSVANSRTAIASRTENGFTVEMLGGDIPRVVDMDDNPVPLVLPPVEAVVVGRRHACVLSPGGSVSCWGEHAGGALGEHRACTPNNTGSCIQGVAAMPTLLPPTRALAAGDDLTCATTADDHVVCWGDPAGLGGSRLPALDPPTAVRLPSGELLAAARVVIDHRTVCAIDHAEQLWCWGERFGATPVQQPERGVLDVAFGSNHSCIIDADGLRCSGDNRNGQCGDLDHARACGTDCTIDDVPIALDATRVVVGERHTCALLRTGEVACFGSNEEGQLGRDDAFLVGEIGIALTDVQDLEAGYAHTCARRDDGRVWCWGADSRTDPKEEL